jgi:hypothetical protein
LQRKLPAHGRIEDLAGVVQLDGYQPKIVDSWFVAASPPPSVKVKNELTPIERMPQFVFVCAT